MSAIDPFQHLRDENARMLADLDSLEHASPAPGHPEGAVDDLRALIARLRGEVATHVRVEDEVIFPALGTAISEVRATIRPLQVEHEELRSMMAALIGLLAEPPGRERDEQLAVQIRDLVDLLRIHVRKEEALVFRVAERVLPEAAIAKLAGRLAPQSSRKGTKP